MVELRRDDNLAPGTWRPVTLDNVRTAKLACPGCGNAAVLDHEIAPDGTSRRPSSARSRAARFTTT